MNKQDLGEELIRISKRIKTIKSATGKIRQEYNNHYFKSIIGNREIGGLRAELHGYQNDDDILLAKSCCSLDEWRKKFVEECVLENHSPDCVRYLNIGSENPPLSDCDCSRIYHQVGGDSMFLVLQYEKKLQDLEVLLKEEHTNYKSVLTALLWLD